jgi:uncharacterized protein with PIN domain
MKATHCRLNFMADETVGKLAKWLRILGYDTFYDPGLPSRKSVLTVIEGRILLTRSRSGYQNVPPQSILRLRSDNVLKQLAEVVATLDLKSDCMSPCRRCIRCNTVLAMVSKPVVYGKVPDYIWETQDVFYRCDSCRRIYWQGTHHRRILETIADIVPPGPKVENDRKS